MPSCQLEKTWALGGRYHIMTEISRSFAIVAWYVAVVVVVRMSYETISVAIEQASLNG